MSILTAILSILTVLFLTALPFIKKFLDKVGISITEKQVELLKKIVEDAVNHVHQISVSDEMDSKQKKLLAISVASNMATKLGIPKVQQELISDLIESILWKQEETDDVESDEDNY